MGGRGPPHMRREYPKKLIVHSLECPIIYISFLIKQVITNAMCSFYCFQFVSLRTLNGQNWFLNVRSLSLVCHRIAKVIVSDAVRLFALRTVICTPCLFGLPLQVFIVLPQQPQISSHNIDYSMKGTSKIKSFFRKQHRKILPSHLQSKFLSKRIHSLRTFCVILLFVQLSQVFKHNAAVVIVEY